MKKLIIFASIIVILIISLTFSVNALFFQHKTDDYICYTNSFSQEYHSEHCEFLNNKIVSVPLWIAAEKGYTYCSQCNLHLYSGTCYITESGKCFHDIYCQYIKNSHANQADVMEAIANGFAPCSKCYSEINLNTNFRVIPNGDWIHNTLSPELHEINFETELNIKQTTISKAESAGLKKCSHCINEHFESVTVTSNNYLLSLLIAFAAVIVITATIIVIGYFVKGFKCDKRSKITS